MKKLILSAIAISTLVACSNEETLNQPSPKAIAFDNAFVYKTRAAADPSISTNGENGTTPIEAFKVWAFMDAPTAMVLEDELVEKENNMWTYDNVQYWMPGHTYYFGAVAPVEGADWTINTAEANTYGLGVLTFTNNAGTQDLLYASTSVSTVGMEVGSDMPAVKLFFSHLLSKVKFTFTNGFETDNISLKVSNIQMSAPKTGTINLNVENWWDNIGDWALNNQDNVQLAFGDVETLAMGLSAECANARLTIPAHKDHTYNISFDVEVFVSGTSAYKVTKTTTLTGVPIEMGKSYNFTAAITPENLDLEKIEFEVIVKDWVEAGDVPVLQ